MSQIKPNVKTPNGSRTATPTNGTTQTDPFDRIEVFDLVHLSDRDAVRARCKVRIGPIIISEVKIILPVLASRVFVGWPSRKDGDTWRSLVQILSPTLEQSIHDAVVDAWRGGVR